MTALTKYKRLECTGLWRAAPDAQRRAVVVSFGESSLVLSDLRSGTALTHWSLPAVDRIGRDHPALYAPGTDGHETLEIEDDTMIAAIETVRSALARHRRQDGRVRRGLGLGLAAVVALALALWLPGALMRHTATVLPDATRAAIGAAILTDVADRHGPPCNGTLGRRALDRLQAQVLGRAGARVSVMRALPRPAAHLPGDRILLDAAVVEGADGPALAAAHILAQDVAAQTADPVLPALRHAGIGATIRLLTTGDLAPGAFSGYAAQLQDPAAPPSAALLAERLLTAGVPAAPFVDATGMTLPDAGVAAAPRPLLSDGEWVSLQGICTG